MVRSAVAVLSLLLVCSAFAETPISDVRPGGATFASGPVTTSWNGEAFLVTWTARGIGARAIRIDASGRTLDAWPIGLPFLVRDVVWTGNVWIAVGEGGWARVTSEGKLLDSQRVPLGSPLTAVWTDERVIVATKLDLVTFDADMNLRETRALVSDHAPLLAWDGERALLLHDRTASILDATGAELRAVTLSNTATPVSIGAIPGGGGFLVVEQAKDARGEGDWYQAERVDHDLHVTLQPDQVGRQGFGDPLSDTMAWDGSAFTFAYDSFGIRLPWQTSASRLSAAGVELDERVVNASPVSWIGAAIDAAPGATLLITLDAETPVAACYDCGAALEDQELRIHARVANAPPVPLDGADVAWQIAPASASSATQSLVTWLEGDAHRVLATRVTANGAVRDPQSLTLGGSACDGTHPAAASDGDDFLVAWYDQTGLMATRIDRDGVAGEAVRLAEMQCSAALTAPLVVSNGSDYLVAWTDTSRVLAARVRASGTLVDTVPLLLGTPRRTALHGASNGTDYILTWDARFARITANGADLDPDGRSLGSGSVDAVWSHGATYSLLRARTDGARWIDRISSGGMVSRATDFFAASSDALASACDRDGCSLAITAESSVRELRAQDDGVSASIRFGHTIAVKEKLLDVAPLRAANGRLFLAYERRMFESPAAGAPRVFLRTMDAQRSRAVRH